MAEFTDQDKELLDELRKVLNKKSRTTRARQPWQESLSRDTTSPVRARPNPNVIEGFSGSWAASYAQGLGTSAVAEATDEEGATEDAPSPVRAKTLKIGLRGVPDVDFVPYNWRTNRFGSKGPSLVGHPISFRVVGPTLKSPFCDWTWEVGDEAGITLDGVSGDLLEMAVRPDGGAPVASTIEGAYGISNFTMGNPTEPNGGLYLLITDDGSNPGSLAGGQVAMGAQDHVVDTARYELFRILDVRANQITVHPNKRLRHYFDLPLGGTRHIRAIAIVQPYVTRLAAVPGSGPPSREQTFVTVSPERAASSDLYPPLDGGVALDGSWLRGGFEPNNMQGTLEGYGGSFRLPVPRPIREGSATVEKTVGTSTFVGNFLLMEVTDPSVEDVGRILHIYQISSSDDVELTHGTRAQALGWFEVLDVHEGNAEYILGRVAEVDPKTGRVFFGPGPVFIDPSPFGPPEHTVYFTVHEPMESLWQGPFNIDDVDASRLRNLVDPSLIERATKQYSDPSGKPPPPGQSPARSDRALFNTAMHVPSGATLPQSENPGSLLDLGFRMVLFPAKEDNDGNPIPDFDRPIVSREVIIDPDIQEQQFLEVDYSAGTVRLSHPPPPRGDGDIVPHGVIAGPTNPRGEVVLFAACVPHSMESSQLGGGVRVTTGKAEDVDAYSQRITAGIDTGATAFLASAPFIGATGIVLDRRWEGPPTGVIDILEGAPPLGAVAQKSFGTWAYSEVDDSGPTSVLRLISSEPGVETPEPPGFELRTVVLRREVFYGRKSDGNAHAADRVAFDTAYGSSQRAHTLRFPEGTLESLLDGSVKVNVGGDGKFAFASHQWGSFFPSKLPRGAASTFKRFSELGIIEPLLYQNTVEPLDDPAGAGMYGVLATHGPNLALRTSPTIDHYYGVITESDGAVTPPTAIVTVASYVRFTTKFSLHSGGGGDVGYRFFTGLLGTDPNITIASVDVATAAAFPGDVEAVGLHVDMGTSDEFLFLGVGSGGPVTIPTGVASDGTGVFHFVMETYLGPQVRFGLFDENFVLLAQGFLDDAAALPHFTPLHVVTGIRKIAPDGRPQVNTFFTTVMTRFDTVGPPLLGP